MVRTTSALLIGFCLLLLIVLCTAAPATAGVPPESITAGQACERVYTGTMRSEYRLCNPDKVDNQGEVHYANYDLVVNSPQSESCITITISSRLSISTSASYPLQPGTIPPDALPYLEADYYVQSDNPEIIALAGSLTRGATSEREAVAAIISWVSSHLSLAPVTAHDALSVLHSRTGTSAGFTTLATALLRAAGIPAIDVTGGIAHDETLDGSWPVGEQGGYHDWVLVFFPGLGWVPSDPQRSINWIDTSHIGLPFAQIGDIKTTITRISYQEELTLVELLAHHYTDTLGTALPLYSAASPSGYTVLRWSPNQVMAAINRGEVITTLISVASFRCDGSWQLTGSAPWAAPASTSGNFPSSVPLIIDSTSLSPGLHYATLTLRTSVSPILPTVSTTIPITLLVGDPLYTIYLPFTANP